MSRHVRKMSFDRDSGRCWKRQIALAAAVLLLAPVGLVRAQDSAEDDNGRFVVIRAGKVITCTGKEIRNGMIVLSGGKIYSVGQGLEYPLNAEIIDARDRVVMPGLIDPHTRYGLQNYSRSGVHGNLSVADEYHPTPGLYDELLDAGYTAITLVPGGGGIPGRALVTRTGGQEAQRVLLSPGYLRVTADKRTFRGGLEKAEKEIEKVEQARVEFEKKQKEEQQKQAEQKKQDKQQPEQQTKQPPESQPAEKPATQPAKPPEFKAPPIDPAHQVLVDLIQKKSDILALIELNNASDFVHMCEVLERFEIAHAFVANNYGQSDLGYIVEKMGQRKARVVLLPWIGSVPYSAERLNLVKMFSEAGCEVSLTPLNDRDREYARMLGRVAELVRVGWSREEALKAVTLYPARLLGLEDRLGTIEKDKQADLIFLDGDPFDPTARVREVMIGGKVIHRVEDYE